MVRWSDGSLVQFARSLARLGLCVRALDSVLDVCLRGAGAGIAYLNKKVCLQCEMRLFRLDCGTHKQASRRSRRRSRSRSRRRRRLRLVYPPVVDDNDALD
jgi:hypothetical protein